MDNKRLDFLFIQCNTKLINKDNKKDISDLFYESIYTLKANSGYFKGSDFWEIPLWIVEISGLFKEKQKELFILKDIKKDIKRINNINTKFILLSILEVNKAFYLELIKNYKGKAKFIIGGYVDFAEFKKFNNVMLFNSIKDLADYFKIDYIYNTDYSLFKGLKIIPRLTLSNGCYNNCKFCTITKKLEIKTFKEIINQAISFKDLDFKLIYINDKTYGQANNYHYLKNIYNIIKRYNKKFKGFIIQTTASQILKNDFYKKFKGLHIKIIELGMESFNNDILRDLKKPHNEAMIDKALNILNDLGLNVILNVIIGILKENKNTYNNTLNYIKNNLNKIFSLNIYNLVIYKNTELAKEIKTNKDNDFNELSTEKSFYTKQNIIDNDYFYNNVFKLGLKVLNNKKQV